MIQNNEEKIKQMNMTRRYKELKTIEEVKKVLLPKDERNLYIRQLNKCFTIGLLQ